MVYNSIMVDVCNYTFVQNTKAKIMFIFKYLYLTLNRFEFSVVFCYNVVNIAKTLAKDGEYL